MRKRIIQQGAPEVKSVDPHWLDVERLAQVEVTSEDPAHPIESALLPGKGSGWRAAAPGEQTIGLLFDEPLRIRHIRLVFHEEKHARTQEFALRWTSEAGQSYQLVRQQYNFSPPVTTREVEDYTVNLEKVKALELSIVPEISGGSARASLAALQLA